MPHLRRRLSRLTSIALGIVEGVVRYFREREMLIREFQIFRLEYFAKTAHDCPRRQL